MAGTFGGALWRFCQKRIEKLGNALAYKIDVSFKLSDLYVIELSWMIETIKLLSHFVLVHTPFDRHSRFRCLPIKYKCFRSWVPAKEWRKKIYKLHISFVKTSLVCTRFPRFWQQKNLFVCASLLFFQRKYWKRPKFLLCFCLDLSHIIRFWALKIRPKRKKTRIL